MRESTVIIKTWCFLIAYIRFDILLLVFSFIIFPFYCTGQDEPQYDEITVNLRVPGIGTSDISALVKNEKAYLSVSDVFTFLKIKNTLSPHLDSISGFFINPQNEYLIDRIKNRIIYQGKKSSLKPDDLLQTETNLYMKIELFGELFGLNCQFNILSLTVDLTTQTELPTVREMKMGQMRENLKRLRGEVKTDTIIKRSYPLLKFGMADWRINSYQQKGLTSNTQLSLNVGSVVAGGEMNIGMYYDQFSKYDLRQQTYLWRYVNNEHRALRQVSIGKIPLSTISSLPGQIVGIQFTNTPTIYRKSFGTYRLSNITEPGWLVELYINSVLVDYVKSDASGFYKFEVPLTYGNSIIKVRMYGPSGEIREKVENADIPFNFLPRGELEYSTTLGVIENEPNTRYTRSNINYGVSRRMSVGGGYEYFLSPKIENSLPYLSTSVYILKNLLIAGEYTYGARLKSSMSFRLPSNLQLNLNYIGYNKEQKIIKNTPRQERGFSVSVPLNVNHIATYSSFSFNQRVYDTIQMSNAFFLFSGNLKGFSTNIKTLLSYYNSKTISAQSDIAFSFILPKHIILRPITQYDYSQKKLTSVQLQIDKPLMKNGYLSVSYYKDFINNFNNTINVGLRFDFSFIQTDLKSQFYKNSSSFSQSANGSIIIDRKSHYLKASNYSMVGKSGLTFYAFLDMNGNGKRERNEPKLLGLNLRINGGRVLKRDKDSTIRVIDLIPYTTYLVELDNNRFQNIAWKVKKTALSVYADPNQFKTIAIPVEINSEAAGTVNYTNKNGTRGLGRIYVDFYKRDGALFGRILTESDGYFSFMGLKPGDYIARIDSFQLANLRMKATPGFKAFTVKESKDGDFIDGLDFTLQSTAKDTTEIPLPKVDSSKIKIINYANNGMKDSIGTDGKNAEIMAESKIPGVRYSQSVSASGKASDKDNAVKPDDLKAISLKGKTTAILNGKPTATLIRPTDQYAVISEVEGQRCSIQYGEYALEKDALSDQRTITMTTGRPVIIVKEGAVYKLWIEGFTSRRAARDFLASLGKLEMPHDVDREVVAMNRSSSASNPGEKQTERTAKTPVGEIKNPNGNNQIIDYTDSIANIYKFEPEGSKTRGYPVKSKQTVTNITVDRNDAKPQTVTAKSIPSAVKQNDPITDSRGGAFSVLVDGFIFDKSATAALRRISAETKLPIIISIKNGFYNLLIEGFASRKEARLFEEKLALMGFKGTTVKGS